MKLLLVSLAVVLVASLISVEAHRGGSGPRGGPGKGGPRGGPRRGLGPRQTDGQRYIFNSTDSDDTVEQEAFIRNSSNSNSSSETAEVRSKGGNSENSKIQKSFSTYFYNNTFAVAVFHLKGFPCFVASIARTYSSIVEFLEANNESTVSVANKVSLNATGQVKKRNETSRDILFLCKGKPVVDATPVDPAQTFPENSTDIAVVSLDTEYTLRVLQHPRRNDSSEHDSDNSSEGRPPPPFGRRGGKGGPRRH